MRVILLALLASFIVACSGGEAESKSESPAKEMKEEKVEKVEEVVKDETPQTVQITLAATGETMAEMAYSPKKINVAPGTIVELTLENQATMAGMIHNAVFINAGSQEEVSMEGMTAGPDAAYVPDNANVIAATPIANPGETVTLTFTAPSVPGTYQFICTYPGHTAMKGLFIVK